MTYQLLATDLDGTLLNDKKEIPAENIAAINDALERGKNIIFSSGRCIDECRAFFSLFPKMHYALCESGACIYDIKNEQPIYQKAIDPSAVQTILEYIHTKNVMIQAMGHGHMMIAREDMTHLDDFYISQYQEHFEKTGTIVESPYEYCKAHDWYAEKICLYHDSPKAREVTKELFESLPVVLAYSEETSLEVSPLGIDKGVGLKILCNHLGISLDETIAIGDGFNDMKILEACGLSVAVANAKPEIQNMCDKIVTDNNHAGVCEAIKLFL